MNPLAILTAASAVALASAVAYAQPSTPPNPGQAQGQGPGRMTRADRDSLIDARIAGIQAGLKLTPEQQKLWPPVEQALRAQAANRSKRMEEFRGRNRAERPDMMTMMERRSEAVTENAEGMRSLTNALKPLWATLDERQKELLPVLMRPARGHGMGMDEGMRGKMERRGKMEHRGMHEPGTGGGMRQGQGGPGQKPAAPQQ